jgi:hypothetical protein
MNNISSSKIYTKKYVGIKYCGWFAKPKLKGVLSAFDRV